MTQPSDPWKPSSDSPYSETPAEQYQPFAINDSAPSPFSSDNSYSDPPRDSRSTYGAYGAYGASAPSSSSTDDYTKYAMGDENGADGGRDGGYGSGYGSGDGYGSDYSQAQRGRVFPLHPLSIGETLDAALRCVRFNPAGFIGFPALVYLVCWVISGGLMLALGESITPHILLTDTSFRVQSSDFGVLIPIVILGFAGLLTSVATVHATVASAAGEKLTIGTLYSRATYGFGRIFVRFILAWFIVVMFAILGVILLIAAIAVFAQLFNEGHLAIAVITVMFIFFWIVAYFVARLIAVVPCMVYEDRSLFKSISRSMKLTKGNASRIFFTLLFATIIVNIVVGVFVLIFSLTPLLALGNSPAAHLLPVLINGFLSTIIATPILSATTNLLYVDLRIRKEDFHRVLLAAPVEPRGDTWKSDVNGSSTGW